VQSDQELVTGKPVEVRVLLSSSAESGAVPTETLPQVPIAGNPVEKVVTQTFDNALCNRPGIRADNAASLPCVPKQSPKNTSSLSIKPYLVASYGLPLSTKSTHLMAEKVASLHSSAQSPNKSTYSVAKKEAASACTASDILPLPSNQAVSVTEVAPICNTSLPLMTGKAAAPACSASDASPLLSNQASHLVLLSEVTPIRPLFSLMTGKAAAPACSAANHSVVISKVTAECNIPYGSLKPAYPVAGKGAAPAFSASPLSSNHQAAVTRVTTSNYSLTPDMPVYSVAGKEATLTSSVFSDSPISANFQTRNTPSNKQFLMASYGLPLSMKSNHLVTVARSCTVSSACPLSNSVSSELESSSSGGKDEHEVCIENPSVGHTEERGTSGAEDSIHPAPLKSVKFEASLDTSGCSTSGSKMSRVNPTSLHLKLAPLPHLGISSGSPVSADEGYLSCTSHSSDAELPFSNFLKSLEEEDLKIREACDRSAPPCPLVAADESVPDIAREIKVESEVHDGGSEVIEEILLESTDVNGCSSDNDIPVVMLSNGDVMAAYSESSCSPEHISSPHEPCISPSVAVQDLDHTCQPDTILKPGDRLQIKDEPVRCMPFFLVSCDHY
jgi:hypothetical protein